MKDGFECTLDAQDNYRTLERKRQSLVYNCLAWFSLFFLFIGQADTKDLSSSSKFSASCVLTLQSLLFSFSLGDCNKVWTSQEAVLVILVLIVWISWVLFIPLEPKSNP